jgi:hypothetical protein
MDEILKDLAEKLHDLRLRSNRVTLRHVLDMAKVLTQARDVAKRDFGRWVREKAHMQYNTASRYLRVASFVGTNSDLNSEIASLSIAKIYAMSSLDSDTARQLLTHRMALSKPLDRLTDVEFLREFRERFPKPVRRRTRVHVFQEISADMTRLKKSLGRGQRFAGQMSELQRERISRDLAFLSSYAEVWRSKRGTA